MLTMSLILNIEMLTQFQILENGRIPHTVLSCKLHLGACPVRSFMERKNHNILNHIHTKQHSIESNTTLQLGTLAQSIVLQSVT